MSGGPGLYKRAEGSPKRACEESANIFPPNVYKLGGKMQRDTKYYVEKKKHGLYRLLVYKYLDVFPALISSGNVDRTDSHPSAAGICHGKKKVDWAIFR